MSALALNSIGVSPGPEPRVNRTPAPSEAPPSPAVSEPEAEPSPAKVLAALAPDNTRLSIVRDETTGRYVFKSIDGETGEVIRQYPTEEMLSLIARMRRITGLTLDTDA